MSTKNVLVFGKDTDALAKVLGVSGEEVDKLKVMSMENDELYNDILKELKKYNMYLETITGVSFTKADAEGYRKRNLDI